MRNYKTLEIKLAALLLSEIPKSHFIVKDSQDSFKKEIIISFEDSHQELLDEIVGDFINRRARVDVFKYNRNLNSIRDKLRSMKEENGFGKIRKDFLR